MRQQSFVHLNEILQSLGLYDYKNIVNETLLQMGTSPCDIVKLDEELINNKLYNKNEQSMEDYVRSKLNEEQFLHFIVLFLK